MAKVAARPFDLTRGALQGKSPAARWRRRVLGMIRFLHDIPRVERSEIGDRWAEGMRMYYGEQLRFLLSHPPRGCQEEAHRYRVFFSHVFADVARIA